MKDKNVLGEKEPETKEQPLTDEVLENVLGGYDDVEIILGSDGKPRSIIAK